MWPYGICKFLAFIVEIDPGLDISENKPFPTLIMTKKD